MDAYEATRIVFSRIQNADPENASKIMGLILIQDHGEKEMVRLAFGPESQVHSVILQARNELGVVSSNITPSSLSSSPSSPASLSRQNSARLNAVNLPSPLSIPNPNSVPWSPQSSVFPNFNHTQDDLSSPNPNFSSPHYNSETVDEFQLQDQLSFLNEGPEPFYPHRRSCSVTDISYGSDDSVSGFGWKPCLYYARGYCKNGTSCRFLHGGPADPAVMAGSPSKFEMLEQCEDLLRSKQRSLLMNSASFPYTSSSNKCINFLLQQQQSDTQRAAAAALMMGDEINMKLSRSRYFPMMNGGMVDMNSSSRQIYLTFPADSTFREEDVSNYFSIFGPVQDVRIPYQQKRMFGFVTFVYADTVKLILAKGNPHFVCDARVLVKPYKEKGKVPDKFRKQGDYSACISPTGVDARDICDLPLGPRMFQNTQDLLWKRKLEEQADFEQALELQSRRLMNLQLLDVKKHHHHRALSVGGGPLPIGSPIQSPSFFNQSPFFYSDRSSSGSPPENCSSPAPAFSDNQLVQNLNVAPEKVPNGTDEKCNGNGMEIPCNEDINLPESLEHILPDSPFASPTKAAGDYYSVFAGESTEKNMVSNGDILGAASINSNLITSTLLPATSTLDAASFNSCYFQMPRFSAGQGAIGM